MRPSKQLTVAKLVHTTCSMCRETATYRITYVDTNSPKEESYAKPPHKPMTFYRDQFTLYSCDNTVHVVAVTEKALTRAGLWPEEVEG